MTYNETAKSALCDEKAVGSIQKLFGTSGELVVKIWDEFPESFSEPLWVDIDSIAVPLFIKDFKKQGNSKAVIVFEDFESVKLAEMLIEKKLYSNTVLMEQSTEFDYLKEMSVCDLTSNKTFRIVDFIDDDFNPLLELEGEILIPFSESLIEKIHKQRKLIYMNLPEGIFDL